MSEFDYQPAVYTSPVDIQGYTNFVYEPAEVVKSNCSYPWITKVECQGLSGPIRIKIIGKNADESRFQRVITGYCISSFPCVKGTTLSNGACACDPWWSGSDCSIPTCLNGGTPNRESCSCPDGFRGDNCEIKESAPDPDRNILILLDVVDFIEPNASEFRKQLATEFIQTYRGSDAKFAYATNSEDDSSWIPLTSEIDDVLDAINDADILPENSTVTLSNALLFFNNQTFSRPDSNGYSVSYIFYITHHRLDFIIIHSLR